ncbi:MAG: DUF5320 domain-containing protein [Candidatus Altiarchaeota archaeon]|nr:DUF5320 domain-containing protein [Candidatus Altiarchaeota archaeon]
MPGLDGTGPRGLGPLTGGGRGFCLTGTSPTTVQPISTIPQTIPQRPMYNMIYRGLGFGRGRGGGRGMGRGRGRWFR